MSSNEGIVIVDKLDKNLEPQKVIFSSIKNNDEYIFNSGPKKDLLNNEFATKNLFNFNENKLSFSITLTDFINEKNNQFRYKLEGYENDYSKFSKNEVITFTNLKPGNYNFYIQGISSEGLISNTNFFHLQLIHPGGKVKYFIYLRFYFF